MNKLRPLNIILGFGTLVFSWSVVANEAGEKTALASNAMPNTSKSTSYVGLIKPFEQGELERSRQRILFYKQAQQGEESLLADVNNITKESISHLAQVFNAPAIKPTTHYAQVTKELKTKPNKVEAKRVRKSKALVLAEKTSAPIKGVANKNKNLEPDPIALLGEIFDLSR